MSFSQEPDFQLWLLNCFMSLDCLLSWLRLLLESSSTSTVCLIVPWIISHPLFGRWPHHLLPASIECSWQSYSSSLAFWSSKSFLRWIARSSCQPSGPIAGSKLEVADYWRISTFSVRYPKWWEYRPRYRWFELAHQVTFRKSAVIKVISVKTEPEIVPVSISCLSNPFAEYLCSN